MDAIFDRHGKTIAWLDDRNIYNLSGNQALAFISHNTVFTFRTKKHLGRFKNGFFRDKNGNAVAFIKGATGGPVTPVTQVTPSSPSYVLRPSLPSLPSIPVSYPTDTYNWSHLDWEKFINQ